MLTRYTLPRLLLALAFLLLLMLEEVRRAGEAAALPAVVRVVRRSRRRVEAAVDAVTVHPLTTSAQPR